ncbi:MAG: transferrin-binding protein-like solute binding protein [Pseudomonadota bacterium]
MFESVSIGDPQFVSLPAPSLHPGGGATAQSEAQSSGLTGVAARLSVKQFGNEYFADGVFLGAELSETATDGSLLISLGNGTVFDVATLLSGDLNNGEYQGSVFSQLLTGSTLNNDVILLTGVGTQQGVQILFATVGLEAPQGNLPTLVTNYTGELVAFVSNPIEASVDFFLTDLGVDVDFGLGTLTGTATQGPNGVVGTMAGTVGSAGVSGTLDLSNVELDTGRVLTTADTNFLGKFFGPGAETLSGVLLGKGQSTANGGQTEALVGAFETRQ